MGYLWKTLKKCGKINLFMGYEWYIHGLLMININAMMEYQWHYDLTLLGLLSRFFLLFPLWEMTWKMHITWFNFWFIWVQQIQKKLQVGDPKLDTLW